MSESAGECSTCGAPFVVAERAGWTVRVVVETLRFRPGGDDKARPIRITAGRHYVFCPGCSALLDAGRFGALARAVCARAEAKGRRSAPAVAAEMVPLLMALGQRLTPPLSDEDIARRWAPKVGV